MPVDEYGVCGLEESCSKNPKSSSVAPAEYTVFPKLRGVFASAADIFELEELRTWQPSFATLVGREVVVSMTSAKSSLAADAAEFLMRRRRFLITA